MGLNPGDDANELAFAERDFYPTPGLSRFTAVSGLGR